MNDLIRHVPNLRFPAFIENGEWKEFKLGDIAKLYKGKGISKNDVSDNGTIPCIRYGELYTHYKEIIDKVTSYTDLPIDNLFMSKANDVIIPSSGETKEDIATASCVLHDNVALGGDINVIRTSNNGVYLSYYLNNAKRHDIAKIAQGISIIHLYNEQLRNLSIELPDLEEQKKIAECLSSIDSYISSINKKMEQLNAHKKSLMQKLFPQNGKSVPEYRFPEFKMDEDWITNRVGESFKLQGGFAFKSNKFNTIGIPVIRISNIPSDSLVVNLQNCVFYEELPNMRNYTANDGDLLIAMSGATTGKTAIYRGKRPVYVNQRVGIFRLIDSSIHYPFICQWIRTEHFASQIKKKLAAGAQPNISSNDVESLLWQHPQNMKEQIQIASCLSTIDDLIDAYKNKLIYIEEYKKGLMQQLFPIKK